MRIILENFRENSAVFIRRCGYGYLASREGEESFVMRISGRDYPRFHAYVKMQGKDLVVNLHLDQKKPSYQGSHRHSAEYDTELVVQEAERIKAYFRRAVV